MVNELVRLLIEELQRAQHERITRAHSMPYTSFIVQELSQGEKWSGRANIVAILAEEDSEIQINRSRLYPMKSDEALTITGIEVDEIYVKSGKIKIIGTYISPVAMPRMITQRSVTLYGVQSAVLNALKQYSLTTYQPYWPLSAKLNDMTVPSGEVWGLAGNMVAMYLSLTVEGTLVVLDDAEVIVP